MEENKIYPYSYNYPKGFMDNYIKIPLDNFCSWGRCFKGYGGCADRGPRYEDCEVWDIPKILDEINRNLKKNPNTRFFLETPNFFDPYKMVGEESYQFQELMSTLIDKESLAYLSVQAIPRDLINFIDEGIAATPLIWKSGIREIWLGLESANRELRNKYSKQPFHNEHLLETIKKLQRVGIRHCFYLVVSLEDTDDTIRETIAFVRETKPYKIRPSDLFRYSDGEQYADWNGMMAKMHNMARYQKIFRELAEEINRE